VSLIETVVAFGKIFFIPIDEATPFLPEMSLLFFKDGGKNDVFPWRAACIDLEMDACGNSINDAAKNLKKSLFMYIEMERKAANGSTVEAAKIITKAAFSKSKQKKEYFDIYRQAKEKYVMQAIEEEERRQEKLRIEKERFNRTNDAIWEKILLKQSVSETPNKKIVPASDVNKNWHPIYTPSNSSRIPSHILKNIDWENLKLVPSGLLLRQLASNG